MAKAKRKKAFEAMGIPEGDRAILCLDGGGIRGILTVQLLKKIEEVAGVPAYELFDMVSGTSTGAIVAGLVAAGKTAVEIETLYVKLVKRVFKVKSWAANRFLNPPLYSKANYRSALKDIVGADTTLQKACKKSGIDLLITAKDVAAGEEVYFSCIANRGKKPAYIGTYKDVLLRSAMEATMSAPTYFTPLERFVDGGVTTFNNPSLAAIIEAVRYSNEAYSADNLTVVSLGTGCRPQFVTPRDVANPPGSDVAFWLQWLMTESGDDASDQQCYLLRTKGLWPGIDFRRFQISLNSASIRKLPNRPLGDIDDTKADWLYDLDDKELADIQLDNVKYFPVMQAIGEAMVEFIEKEAGRRKQNPFSFDLVDAKTGKEMLVARRGDVQRIKQQMKSQVWLDKYSS